MYRNHRDFESEVSLQWEDDESYDHEISIISILILIDQPTTLRKINMTSLDTAKLPEESKRQRENHNIYDTNEISEAHLIDDKSKCGYTFV